MNLENLGVREMNTRELTTVDGGLILFGIKTIKKVFEVLGVADALGEVGDGIIDGWNSRRN